ncbi:hypothetical protein H312_00393 [Anncaliia algerae PRA339]|uniref:DNA-directed RNA polymerase RBP11-like dimerisation domain-containing protein n=1 Tax=Anncaliia algerae PRA339 TaxID=1288291 RepID=A0A059F4D3_9MICR|nr:hypothetical protein H312_00393 [Anncaliia algerae PRA339]
MTEEEQKYLEIKYDKNSLNTIELTIYNESHTLANMIQEYIQNDPSCTFCAYKVSHPGDNFVKIKVTSDTSKPVRHLVIDSLRKLSTNIKDLIEEVNEY